MQNDLLAHNTKRIDIYLCPIYYKNAKVVFNIEYFWAGYKYTTFFFTDRLAINSLLITIEMKKLKSWVSGCRSAVQ